MLFWRNGFRLTAFLAALILGLYSGTALDAQSNPFASGWTLQAKSSSLNFQSVKNQTKVESSGFATFSGTIAESGDANVKILLDSVDTKIDLRNVRMRFLFFETFQFPTATISVKLDPASFADLPQIRRKTVRVPYTLDLHGIQKTFEADVAVTLLTDDLVAVTSSTPISVATTDFNLDGGIAKLEDAAGVKIIPSATVSFDFVFARNTASQPAQPEQPTETSAALETAGDFDLEACKGRFEILSRTGSIYFRPASARIDNKSLPLLNSLTDIVARCPGLVIEVGGHTDSIGGDAANLRLSKSRAASVTKFLTNKGIESERVIPVGYGEKFPIATNATKEGRWKNRRIEFKVVTK